MFVWLSLQSFFTLQHVCTVMKTSVFSASLLEVDIPWAQAIRL